jgi:hypothetical protein
MARPSSDLPAGYQANKVWDPHILFPSALPLYAWFWCALLQRGAFVCDPLMSDRCSSSKPFLLLLRRSRRRTSSSTALVTLRTIAKFPRRYGWRCCGSVWIPHYFHVSEWCLSWVPLPLECFLASIGGFAGSFPLYPPRGSFALSNCFLTVNESLRREANRQFQKAPLRELLQNLESLVSARAPPPPAASRGTSSSTSAAGRSGGGKRSRAPPSSMTVTDKLPTALTEVTAEQQQE